MSNTGYMFDKDNPHAVLSSGAIFRFRDDSFDKHPDFQRDFVEPLGRLARWTGQTDPPWSVLKHTLLVAQLVNEPRAKLLALTHDFAEAITGDVPAPLKVQLHVETEGLSFKEWEEELLHHIRAEFGIPNDILNHQDAVDAADSFAGLLEFQLIKQIGPIFIDYRPNLDFGLYFANTVIACEFGKKVERDILKKCGLRDPRKPLPDSYWNP